VNIIYLPGIDVESCYDITIHRNGATITFSVSSTSFTIQIANGLETFDLYRHPTPYDWHIDSNEASGSINATLTNGLN
jgi:hypothetical protein